MSVADDLRPIVDAWVAVDVPVEIRCWDGSALGAEGAGARLVVRSPLALAHLLWSPNELGLGRAYVSGALDIEGDIYAALSLRDSLHRPDDVSLDLGPRQWWSVVRAARRLGALGPRPSPPPEEARLSGRRHTRARDAAAVAHHYDVSNDFYRLVLGRTLTYSCAYFHRPGADLDEAQAAKYELICRKLGLRPGDRLLDVGCGWGSMALHAARHHGARVVGVTVSRRQVELARRRVEDAGLRHRVEIRFQDYRDIDDGPFDAISSIGMFEHVGLARLAEYFDRLASLLHPGGRLLNHGISRPWNANRSQFDRHSFIENYVFPDGELHEVGQVVTAMAAQGFEVRDVENLREHYARTLRCWVANLEAGWDEAVGHAGEGRARVWRIYMAGSALNFEANRTQIHQTLAVWPHSDGRSDMPSTRHGWLAPMAHPTVVTDGDRDGERVGPSPGGVQVT